MWLSMLVSIMWSGGTSSWTVVRYQEREGRASRSFYTLYTGSKRCVKAMANVHFNDWITHRCIAAWQLRCRKSLSSDHPSYPPLYLLSLSVAVQRFNLHSFWFLSHPLRRHNHRYRYQSRDRYSGLGSSISRIYSPESRSTSDFKSRVQTWSTWGRSSSVVPAIV